MPRDVIAWPDAVVATGWKWTERAPVRSSRSMFTGADYDSRFGLARIEASLRISALGGSRSGAGYSEMLIRYLDGGVNLIRLNSRPINWYQDCARLSSARSSQRLDWYLGDETFGWQAGAAPLYWFAGPVLNGTVSGNALEVTGLPPSTLVARPAEFVRLFPMLDGASALVSQVVTEASSDANGVAVLRLFDAVPDGVYPRVNIGDSDSRVFKATDISRPMQTARGNWFYEWTFREVFAHEVGGFNEVNPWD